MFDFPHPNPAPRLSRPEQLSAGYAQLQDVDQALIEAELNLKAAHRNYAQRRGPRPEGLYAEVVRLREQSRHLLDQLADLFLREEQRGPRHFT
jgi:hypothetical protein